MTRWGGVAAAFLAFAILATANAGGYRFGVSDQAYYAVAVMARADPALFPRDRPLLDAQSRFMLSDDLLGSVAKVTGNDLPDLFFALYVLTLAGLFTASIIFARRLGLSWWAVGGMLILLTLRHRISKTGANTLEGYMHVRMLAFACGVAALAAATQARLIRSAVWVAIAAVLHTTTALWFGLAIALGNVVVDKARRRWLLIGALPIATVAAWAVFRGPLAGRFAIMDAEWLAVLQSRDYLFPTAWPAYAWITNFAYPVVLTLIYRARLSKGRVTAGERSVFFGVMGLIGLFLLALPFCAARVALAIQLQITRVFWLADFLTTAYLAWWLFDVWLVARPVRIRRLAVASLVLLAAVRGGYAIGVEHHRALVEIGPPGNDWTATMTWLRQQPASWHVLVDPGHSGKYGVSVRLGAGKDILLDGGKDPALATYDRAIAMRVADRSAALADFDGMTVAGARSLRSRYAVDVLLVEAARAFDLPELYRNAGFVVYDLR